jgi:hypothetical protein
MCSSISSMIAADSSNGVTNNRCCRHSCMRSRWWVEVPPETHRAVSRYNKLCNVASCWICIGIYLRCTDPWTLYHEYIVNILVGGGLGHVNSSNTWLLLYFIFTNSCTTNWKHYHTYIQNRHYTLEHQRQNSSTLSTNRYGTHTRRKKHTATQPECTA